jgi:WD40 repeat protein
LVFSPDGTCLASSSQDGTVGLWEVNSGPNPRLLPGHQDAVNAVAFSADGQRIASAGNDGTVKIWSRSEGVEVATLTGHRGRVSSVAFTPDGRLVSVANSADRPAEIKLWNGTDQSEARSWHLPEGETHATALSPDGQTLARATGAWEDRGEIELWNVANGARERTLRGHTHIVNGLCFSPDGKRLASAGFDNVAKVSDPATGQELRSLPGERRFLCVAFSPDGTRLVAGCQDNSATHEPTLKVWDARPPDAQTRGDHQVAALLDFLFSRPLRRDDVREYVRQCDTLSPATRERALSLVELYPEETNPDRYFQSSWSIVCRPGFNATQYRYALRQAVAASSLSPEHEPYQISRGAAEYRTGNYAEARTTLSRGKSLAPARLAFLAMAQFRLGEHEQARKTLEQLQQASVEKAEPDNDDNMQQLLTEMRALLNRNDSIH